MEKQSPPDIMGDPAALDALIEAASALHRRIRAVRDEVHHLEGMPGGSRAILRELERRGPQTVPQMARERPASRQHVQTMVNRLHRDGYVEFVPNPAHRRSHLVQLTERGGRRVERMVAREDRVLRGIAADTPECNLYETAELLRKVRRDLEKGRWKSLLREGGTMDPSGK